MKILEIMIIAMLTCGCTISINMVHTEGQATDLIDEVQSPTNDVKPELSIPVSGI